MTRKKKGNRPKTVFWILVGIPGILLALAALLNWVLIPLILRHGRELTVPVLTGLKKDDAVRILQRTGLALGEVRNVSDTTYAADEVVSQYPHAGRRVKRGRAVHLDVSRGPDLVTVPDVTGTSLATALAELTRLGLKVAEVESLRTPNFPPDQVIALKPAAGAEVKKGTAVVVAVSAPMGRFPMPNLVGIGLETAAGILASQGLLLGQVKEAQSEEPSGLVLVQYPEEGMPVQNGDSVHLIIAVPAPAPDSQQGKR